MPAVVIWLLLLRKNQFSSADVVTIAWTHFAYPRRLR